jgi:hypothetical protein
MQNAIAPQPALLGRVSNLEAEVNQTDKRIESINARLDNIEKALGIDDPTAPQVAAASRTPVYDGRYNC